MSGAPHGSGRKPVCAAVIRPATRYKPLPTKHFAKPLTVRTGLLKGRIRPWQELGARTEPVSGHGCGKRSIFSLGAQIPIYEAVPSRSRPQ